MKKNARIYIAGHSGLVGSALYEQLHHEGYTDLITQTLDELDLRNQEAVNQFFLKERPEYIFLAAAKVGGIKANYTFTAEFIYDNLMIEANVIHAAYTHKATKLLFLGSSCIYPRLCKQPIAEEYLMTGALEETNEPYAIAKIAGIKMCQAYNKQYGTQFVSCMPTNLYGPRDNFNVETSHVVPGLIAKMYAAHIIGQPSVTLWGTGAARREFLYVEDLAKAAVFLMHNYQENSHINIGTGTDITIKELAYLIRGVIGYQGELLFDAQHPDGTPQKLLCVDKIQNLGWKATTTLVDGLQKTVAWYRQQHDNAFHSHAQYTAKQQSHI